ncbi:MAG: metallophosphoesterase [Pirellulales bacterium]
MRIGIFADCHDHLANVRLAVDEFNRRACEVVLFAGDLVSTFAVPPLRRLQCPFVGCFGDNEGNLAGLRAGMRVIGRLEEAPVRYESADGRRFVIVHMLSQARGLAEPFDVLVYGHTHKPRVRRDNAGRLLVNPGETSGWTFGRPTIAVLETNTMAVELVDLAARAVAATSRS